MKQKPTDRALAQSAYRIRRYSVQMGEIQGQGYVGQALGYADVLAVAYCHAMNFKPEDLALLHVALGTLALIVMYMIGNDAGRRNSHMTCTEDHCHDRLCRHRHCRVIPMTMPYN
jgi:hypothetical protein